MKLTNDQSTNLTVKLKFKATINNKEQVNYIMLNYDQLTQIKPKRTILNN